MPQFTNDPVVSVTDSTNTPAVQGVSSTMKGVGVSGRSTHAAGVLGESAAFDGVLGVTTSEGHAGVAGVSDTGNGNGVYGRSKNVDGVVGYSEAIGHSGVAGVNEVGDGFGVYGRSKLAAGVYGESAEGEGVRGTSKNANHGGVVGVNTGGGIAVYGTSDNSVGVWGTSVNHEGMHAETHSATTAALAAYQMNPDSTSAALYAKHQGNGPAAVFDGNVHVSGDIILANADCAEDFDVTDDIRIEPGTVMVLGDEGKLLPSHKAYDKCVAGVVSGAGDYKPGIVLDKQQSAQTRKPIALLGKVYCKVDARHGAIEIGDLLTTSPTAGHAMRVDDPFKALGTIIGKALRPLTDGQGLIPILIALQ